MEGGARGARALPTSRLRYSNGAVTLMQQLAQNSYSLLIVQYSQNYTSNAPKFNLLAKIFWGGGMPPTPLDKESPLK